MGRISVPWSRPLQGTPKTGTLARAADGWYVAIACATVLVHPVLETGQETGIDLGLAAFATLADGTRIRTPGSSRRAERYLAQCQRRVSRRKQGSQRRRKAVGVLAKAQPTVRRQRQAFHHKTALNRVRANDVI